MLCRTCLWAARLPSAPTRRFLSTSAPRLASAPAPSPSPSTPAPSTQPFSATAALSKAAKTAEKADKKSPLVRSSVAAGTPLRGLNFEKNKTDPVARADDEYPDWLWTLLSRQEGAGGDVGAVGDLFSKSKKQRRLAAKRLRKEQALNPELLAPKIPLYEQTIDLPRGDGSVAGAAAAARARAELNGAMRHRRRAGIKEANFLKTMG
ncbi:uncharacterized protein M421DRAFT_416850 [Didymella exigua CBS 183.55]|uniref:Large ribosomal subunit protein mL54 n=1 Tax=Didymella exigua CBS 183.55 TaxID=1150837 RepID=A0A6A5RX24_9PLEO|nr:uncharacterized protein M421DRAFT_416850 [Didymella exigua CBS 183.55]KAF1932123.1 hypothetical protein M421DRAFT_416850 [Didymella exigua CBS 183.55]